MKLGTNKFRLLVLCVLMIVYSTSAQPRIEVKSLNTGVFVRSGTVMNINWTAQGVVNVKIEYSSNFNNGIDSVTRWTPIVGSVPASVQSYLWTIPATAGSTRIRISDANNPLVYDINDADLSVTNSPMRLKLITPNGGESWRVGDTLHNISWSYEGVFIIALDYSIDNGVTWNQVPNVGAYSFSRRWVWKIPNTPTTQGKIRIRSADDSSITDISDLPFTITNATVPKIEVKSQNGYTIVNAGQVMNINWSFLGVTNVKIEFSSNFNNGIDSVTRWTTITTSTPSVAQSYAWIVPAFSGVAQIRISDANNPLVYDINDVDIIVTNTPRRLKLITPNGGESWKVGDTLHNISWSYEGNFPVALDYSWDNGATWNEIPNVSANSSSRSWVWKIPNTLTTQGKIRIRSADDSSITDISDLPFTITNATEPKIEVKSQNGHSFVGTQGMKINWSFLGVTNVKIEYWSKFGMGIDSVTRWTPIVNSVPASVQSYLWTKPAGFGFTRIRISDASNPLVYDINDSDFNVNNSPMRLKLITPNGGENWRVGDTLHNITWSYEGIFPVSLDYSLDNGATWNEIPNVSAYSFSRSWVWKIPNALTTQAKIRVRSTEDSSISDVSDLPFTITGPINNVKQIETDISFWLGQNQPNPFKPSTIISYSLKFPSDVHLSVINSAGQEVAQLVNGRVLAGVQKIVWNASVSSGIYFLRLEAKSVINPQEKYSDIKKMILMP